jgi:hypothetical protein
LHAQDRGAGYDLILTSDIKALKAGNHGFQATFSKNCTLPDMKCKIIGSTFHHPKEGNDALYITYCNLYITAIFMRLPCLQVAVVQFSHDPHTELELTELGDGLPLKKDLDKMVRVGCIETTF